LLARQTTRLAEGYFVVEGAKLLDEAMAAGTGVESVYVDRAGAGPAEHELAERAVAAGSRVFDLEPGVLTRVAGTVTPQPILAVVARTPTELPALKASKPRLVLVCVDVRDPGNAGTVLRSADAAGADAVVYCDGAVDPYNPKTVRASAGAVFHLPIVAGGDASLVLDELAGWGLRRWATVAHRGQDYTTVDLSCPSALVLGNEANGLPPELSAHLDGEVSIPMRGRAESLNVGVAAAVICFEAARQRGAGRPT
jgi:TrmH family RNA methyltransferase